MFEVNEKIKDKQSLEQTTFLLGEVVRGIKALANKDFPDEMDVGNLDDVQAYLRNELGKVATRLEKALKHVKVDLPTIKISETIKLSNIGDLKPVIEAVGEATKSLATLTERFTFEPQVDVNVPDVIVPDIVIPEIKLPRIIVPKPEVTITNPEMDMSPLLKALQPLKLISDKPNKPITVRMSDGKKFVKALKQAVKENSDGILHAFSSSGGMDVDEYRAYNNKYVDPLNGYRPCDIDETASPFYYGLTKASGEWYIMQETKTGSVSAYRYIKGENDYATNWTGKAGLSYDYFYTVFG